MFSKAESRQLRQEFWTSFGKSFPKKWILYNTKIKGLAFKFHFDTKQALVALDLDSNLENHIIIWDKLLSLKSILQNQYLPQAIFEAHYSLENGKVISRIYVPFTNSCSIHNKATWQEVMLFFNANMLQFEIFFEDYKDLIKP